MKQIIDKNAFIVYDLTHDTRRNQRENSQRSL